MDISTKRDLEDRFENIAAGSGRQYEHSFLGKAWLADHVADVDAAVDELRAEVETVKAERDKLLNDAWDAASVGFQELRQERDDARAEAERLRAGWDECQTYMALSLETRRAVAGGR